MKENTSTRTSALAHLSLVKCLSFQMVLFVQDHFEQNKFTDTNSYQQMFS